MKPGNLADPRQNRPQQVRPSEGHEHLQIGPKLPSATLPIAALQLPGSGL